MPPLRPASETVMARLGAEVPSAPVCREAPVPFSSYSIRSSSRRMTGPYCTATTVRLFVLVLGARARLLLWGALLTLLDELADLVPALAADLLVERRAPLRLDRLA